MAGIVARRLPVNVRAKLGPTTAHKLEDADLPGTMSCIRVVTGSDGQARAIGTQRHRRAKLVARCLAVKVRAELDPAAAHQLEDADVPTMAILGTTDSQARAIGAQ